jgi:hypothetical protein
MYIDPGTGSVLFQIIIAGLLGAGVFIKIFWKKIISLFSKKDASGASTSESSSESEGEAK